MTPIPLRFFPLVSHAQFFLGDEGKNWDPRTCWNDETVGHNIAVMEEAIGVGTVMVDGYADVEVEVLQGAPDDGLEDWDQVIECSISVPSGRLRISTPAQQSVTPAIELPKGTYRARVCWGNVHAIHERLNETTDPDRIWFQKPAAGELRDRYRILLWPCSKERMGILKKIEGPVTW